jgi:multicomponent Na+:H+ antiporter subunit C
VSLLPYVVAAYLLLLGLYGIATSRNLVHAVVCLSVCQSATYVLLITLGYRHGATAPVFSDAPPGTRVVDPVVQALVLTDVVVGAAVTALLLAIALQVDKRHGTVDPDQLQSLRG